MHINIKTATGGFTPLFWAAVYNHWNIVNLFLRNGADVNAKDNDLLETALHEMAHQGKLDMAKILVENGANVHERDGQGFTALHVAAVSNEVEIAELLIQKGADVNVKSAYFFTPLHVSFAKNNLEMSLILLKSGASLIYKDPRGNNAMESYLERGGIKVFKTLVAFQHWCL